MYIYPNTDIYLLNGVSLNADYDHTIYFTSLGLQSTFFLNHTKYALSNNYYVRKERGYIQVEKNQNDLWDCTYMMYRNTSYKNKWFYAFITSVDYVNDNVSLIHFEIDVIQTWWNEAILDKCFVEREHSATDNYFENTIQEDVDIGTEYINDRSVFLDLDPTRICLVVSGRPLPSDPTIFDPVVPYKKGNYFCGLRYIGYDLEDSTDYTPTNNIFERGTSYLALKRDLMEMISSGYENAIVKIYQYPRFLGNISIGDSSSGLDSLSEDFTVNYTSLNGYLPKNKKLFTYPYTFINVDNSLGESYAYKLELWNSANSVGKFRIIGSYTGIPQTLCYPINYRQFAYDYQSGLPLTVNIECAWLGDAFQVWLAQNGKNQSIDNVASALSIMGGLAGVATGVLIENPAVVQAAGGLAAGATGGFVKSVFNEIKTKNKLEATPRTLYGHTNNTPLNLQAELTGYRFCQMSIKSEYAKIVDEYFSKFGYACHNVKVPNRNARQNWTYVKTIGCEINGNIPSDDVVKIKAIYDHGITFWNNGNNIGNYGDFTNPIYS